MTTVLQNSQAGGADLQFDRVDAESSPAQAERPSVRCGNCGTAIDTEYYECNGTVLCDDCRTAVESALETPRGVGPLVRAATFGLGAGILGAVIYFAVIAITNLEIGIVAVLIGYLIGRGVRSGARGRGGRRFQVLAVALTYASVALAYAPLVIRGAIEADQARQTAVATSANAATPEESAPAGTTHSGPGGVLLGLGILAAFLAAFPVLMVLETFPSGLISAFIIFIGMSQAWRMTGTPPLQVFGPYRVGPAPASTTA